MAKKESSKKNAFTLIKRFWRFARPHQRYAWIMVALLILSTPLSVVSPLIIRRVIDQAIEDSTAGEIVHWGLVLVGMTLASVCFGIGIGYTTTLFHTKVGRDIRLDLYRHMQGLSLRYHNDHETGWMMSRQVDDVGNLHGVMADTFGRAAVALMRAIAFTVMLFLVEWHMALGGLLLAAIVFGFEWMISKPLRERSKAARESWTAVSEILHQGLSGHFLVQSTASERRDLLRFTDKLHASVRAGMRRDMFSLWTNHVFHLFAGVAPTIIILVGVWLIVTTGFTVGGLFAFFIYLTQMFGAVGEIAGMNPAMQSSLASLERIYEVLDTTPEIVSPKDGRRLDPCRGDVAFESVSFGYVPDKLVLRDVSFHVPPHTMVALVGPSGAGKTTLAHLLPRFYDVTSGKILVDGVDVRDLDLRGYRRRIGIVPQEIFLFDRSIAENIAYGRPGATPDEIRAAAKAANALEFIEALPQGLETLIGERGVKLSGGQRQRLAIAREILRDPTILILDEATSNLDSRSEALIQDALETLLEGRTSFVIAHRLSTIMRADVIFVLEEGRIVDRGRHSELLARGGLYSSLYHSQFSRPLEGAEQFEDVDATEEGRTS